MNSEQFGIWFTGWLAGRGDHPPTAEEWAQLVEKARGVYTLPPLPQYTPSPQPVYVPSFPQYWMPPITCGMQTTC